MSLEIHLLRSISGKFMFKFKPMYTVIYPQTELYPRGFNNDILLNRKIIESAYIRNAFNLTKIMFNI